MNSLFELISKSLNTLKSMGEEDPDERVIQALKLALEVTTPERPGNSWEHKDHILNKVKEDEWI